MSLVEFFNLYLRGRLAEAFVEKYAVAPHREVGVPQRIGHVTTGEELLEIIKKYNRLPEPKPIYVSFAITDGAQYRALDRVCVDLDAPGRLEEIRRALAVRAAKFADVLWLEFTGKKGYRVCVFLQRLIEIDQELARKALKGYQQWLIEKLRMREYADRQVLGDLKRLFRAPYTLHQESRRRAAPVDPRTFETLAPKEATAAFLDKRLIWLGLKALAYAEDIVIEIPRSETKRGRRNGALVCLKNPELGEICAPGELSGYGWIKYLIANNIYLADARRTVIWTALGAAAAMGVVDRGEAAEWLKACINTYPDPEGEPAESYLRLFEYFTEYRKRHEAKPPTWRTLATWRSRDGEIAPWTRHLAVNVLYALWKAGVIKVERPDALEKLWREELNYKPPRRL